MFAWTSWKPAADSHSELSIEAPAGPGVFEVRRISTGETVAFDHTANVPRALLSILAAASRRRLFTRRSRDVGDLEYRTCAAATAMDAKAIAARLHSQRRLFWRHAIPV
jgi:hypothetical protein